MGDAVGGTVLTEGVVLVGEAGLVEMAGPGMTVLVEMAGPGETVELGALIGPAAVIVGFPAGPVLPVGGVKAIGALLCAVVAGDVPIEVGAAEAGTLAPVAALAGLSTGGATDDRVTLFDADEMWPVAVV